MKKLLVILLCLTMLPLTMFSALAAGDTQIDSGNVLYYQRFNKAYTDLTVEKTGIVDIPHESYKPEKDYTTIDEYGYLLVDNGGLNSSQDIATLPDVIPTGVETYTVEMKFRFGPGYKQNSGPQLKFGYGKEGSQSIVLRYGETLCGEFLRVGFVDMSVVSAWQIADGQDYGEWVELKVEVQDGYLHKVTVSCGEASWSTEDCEYKEKLPAGQLYIRQMYGKIAYSYIRIVEGIGYTEYKGQYATTSYSGHTDAAAEPDEDDTLTPDENGDSNGDSSVAPSAGGDNITLKDKTDKETTADTTDAESETTGETETEENSGCGASVAFAGVAMMTATGACLSVSGRKRRED